MVGKYMKKGFTLIELLAVLIIISVLAAIGTPKLMGFLDDSKQKAYNTTVDRIEDAAQLYVTEHTLDYIDDDDFDLTTAFLCTEKYLSCPIYDPRSRNTEITGTVNVLRVDGTLTYTFTAN